MAQFEKTLSVRMLGEFSLTLDGKPLVLNTGNSTKAAQILQYILHSHPAPVPAAVLVQKIFGTDEIINPRNNMKVSISQLRKLLTAAGLPGDHFISTGSNGYYWSCPVNVQLDTQSFLHAYKIAAAETDLNRKIELFYDCIDRYHGNFLPMLTHTEWALGYQVYYANQYSDAVKTLCRLLKNARRWEEVLELAEDAYHMLRTDEWKIMCIEAQMNLGRWDEAKQSYDEAVAALAKEYDLPPTESMLAAYNQISRHTVGAFTSLNDMLACIHEPERHRGAYHCTFMGFIDLYRVMVRSMMRDGTIYCLLLCTLADREQDAVSNEDRLGIAADRVAECIRVSLRSGDFYAQYSKSQFIICLSNTNLDNCDMIAERIRSTYQKDPVRGIHLYFDATPARALDSLPANPPTWSK